MTTTLTQTLITGAPVDLQTRIAENADPVMRGHLQRVAARPASIKKLRAHEAEEVICYIDNPLVLAAISEKDKRVGVHSAVISNPAWRSVPHRVLCPQCRSTTATIDDAAALRQAIGEQKITCPRRVLTVLEQLNDRDLWEDSLVRVLLENSAALYVAAAAGRVPESLPYATSSHRGHYATLDMRQLLAEEPHSSGLLLHLAARTTREIPRHWSPTTAQWREALSAGSGIRTLLSLTGGPTLETVEELWEDIPAAQRLWVLDKATTAEELTRIAARLRSDAVLTELPTGGPLLLDALSIHDDLDEETRITLATAMGSHQLVEYLGGRGGCCPKSGEVRPLMAALMTTTNHQSTLIALVRTLSRTAASSPLRHHRELIETLVDCCEAGLILGTSGPIAQAGHRRIWAALEPETHAATVAMLLREWDGTINELIETAGRL